jgi:AraC-like DNA-binding protein
VCHPALMRALVFAQRLKDLALLRRVRDRIDREYARPLDVEALARGVGMAAGQLSHQFRLAYGASPYHYLMARRVERATAVLHRSDLGTAEVCAAVGGPSAAAFSARFTALIGVPPGPYRRQAVRATAVPPPQRVPGHVTVPARQRPAPVPEPAALRGPLQGRAVFGPPPHSLRGRPRSSADHSGSSSVNPGTTLLGPPPRALA